MCPSPVTEGHDPPRLGDELFPGVTAGVNDRVVAGEHADGDPIVAQELPDVLLRVQLGALGWQRDDGDVRRNDQPLRDLRSVLVDQQHGMPAGATRAEISTRSWFIASVLHHGMTSPAALPSAG